MLRSGTRAQSGTACRPLTYHQAPPAMAASKTAATAAMAMMRPRDAGRAFGSGSRTREASLMTSMPVPGMDSALAGT
jgi:hypothetical protein